MKIPPEFSPYEIYYGDLYPLKHKFMIIFTIICHQIIQKYDLNQILYVTMLYPSLLYIS